MKKHTLSPVLHILIVLVAFVGLMDASFITYEKLAGVTPSCLPGFSCADVLSSSWAYLFGIPLAVYGVLFYYTTLVFGLMRIFSVQTFRIPVLKKELQVKNVQHFLAIFGFGFSLYLLTIMGVILQAWCFFCLVSAICCIVLFLLNMWDWCLEKRA
jgi:uncharacterized membrane protein